MITYYTNQPTDPIFQGLSPVLSLQADLTDVAHSVIVLVHADLDLIDQIHTAWRNNDLLVVVIGSTEDYFVYGDTQRQLKQSLFIKQLHYQHAHKGVKGPWLVQLRLTPGLTYKYIQDTIQWLLANRHRSRIMDMVIGHDPQLNECQPCESESSDKSSTSGS
jgi:hypothetical protein